MSSLKDFGIALIKNKVTGKIGILRSDKTLIAPIRYIQQEVHFSPDNNSVIVVLKRIVSDAPVSDYCDDIYIINSSGNIVVIENQYIRYCCSLGIQTFSKNICNEGLIGWDGQELLSFNYDGIYVVNDGRYVIVKRDNKERILKCFNNSIIAQTWDYFDEVQSYVNSFEEVIFCARKNDTCFFLNEDWQVFDKFENIPLKESVDLRTYNKENGTIDITDSWDNLIGSGSITRKVDRMGNCVAIFEEDSVDYTESHSSPLDAFDGDEGAYNEWRND